MPEALIETAPADAVQPGAPTSADPSAPSPDAVPENVRKLLDVLNREEQKPDQSEPKREAPPRPAEKKAEAPAKPAVKAADPASPAPADPGMKLRTPKVERPALPLATPAAPVSTPKEEPFKADPQWESGLEENEREMMADAKFMEGRFPEKYQGLAARTAKFIKEHADKTASPEFDSQSHEYKTWLDKNQPRLTREQIREVEEVRVADRVKKEYDGKLADVTHKLFVREKEPEIQQYGKNLFTEASHSALPDEVTEAIKKDGYEKASQTYALELQTAQAFLSDATERMVELKRIGTIDPDTGRPLQPVINDPSHPKYKLHQEIGETVGRVEEHFKQNAPANVQNRAGKWFVTRDEWAKIEPAQRHRFWRLTFDEIIDIGKSSLKPAIAARIEEERSKFTKLGFTRVTAPVAPKPMPKAEPPQPTNTPRLPAATPTPGESEAITEIDARAARLAAQLGR